MHALEPVLVTVSSRWLMGRLTLVTVTLVFASVQAVVTGPVSVPVPPPVFPLPAEVGLVPVVGCFAVSAAGVLASVVGPVVSAAGALVAGADAAGLLCVVVGGLARGQ